MAENYLQDKGNGNWIIGIYNPLKDIGPFVGILEVGKDFHCVKNSKGDCVVNIPSQNVAYCVNMNIAKDYGK